MLCHGAVTGEYNLGGLVGSNSGTITSSYATGTVTGSEGVFSTYNIGGLGDSATKALSHRVMLQVRLREMRILAA